MRKMIDQTKSVTPSKAVNTAPPTSELRSDDDDDAFEILHTFSIRILLS
jgi:hypothetical protein